VVHTVKWRSKKQQQLADGTTADSWGPWRDSRLETVKALGSLYYRMGSAIGVAAASDKLTLFSPVFSFQPVCTIRGRPISQLDAQLEPTQLVVLDAGYWLPGKLQCVRGGCTGTVEARGWHTNAHSSKGDGRVHTIYVATRKRQCK
jgi:hypothetical protein